MGRSNCARGCVNDGHGGGGGQSSCGWLIDRLSQPGAVGYFTCGVHGAPGVGMSGTISDSSGTAITAAHEARFTTKERLLALLGAAFIACAVLRRARTRGKNSPRDPSREASCSPFAPGCEVRQKKMAQVPGKIVLMSPALESNQFASVAALLIHRRCRNQPNIPVAIARIVLVGGSLLPA
jgi:hypothetical protein